MKRTHLLLLVLLLAAVLAACGKKKEADLTPAADNALSNTVQLSAADAAYLEYDNGQVTCRFRRDEGGWKWVDNESFPLDGAYPEQMLAVLDAMFVSLTPETAEADPTLSGLDEPDRYLCVTVGEESTTLRFGKQAEDGRWYMSIDGDDGVYLAANELVEMMDRGVYDMAVLPALPELTEENLTAITVQSGEGRSVRLAKEEDGWVMTAVTVESGEGQSVPPAKEEDGRVMEKQPTSAQVQAAVEALAAFSFDSCFDFDPSPEAVPLCGLDTPTVITVTYINSVGTETTMTLALGALREDGAYYATFNDSAAVYLVSQDKAAAFLALL